VVIATTTADCWQAAADCWQAATAVAGCSFAGDHQGWS